MRLSRIRTLLATSLAVTAGVGSGCGGDTAKDTSTTTDRNEEGVHVQLKIESSAFQANKPMPKKHTGDGDDSSPPLSWSGVPAEARQLALICDDPDAPITEPWVHWVLYKLPGDLTELKAAIPPTGRVADPAGAIQGKNSWGTIGYRGPAPPRGHGVHHYHFKLYALDSELELPGELTKDELLSRVSNHVIAEAEIVGTYER